MSSLSTLLVLALLTAFAPLTIDMYLPALTAIQTDLHTSASHVQLTLACFMAGMGVGQLAYGPLSDRWGRLRPLLAGIALYVAASVACALVSSIGQLIAWRFVQALGAASGPVIARAVVRDRYQGREVARVLSILMLVMGAAPILAPLLGGALLAHFHWRAIFAALAAIGALAFGLALPAVPGAVTAPPLPLRDSARTLWSDSQFLAASLAGGFPQAAMFAYIAGAPFVFMQRFAYSAESFALLFGTNAAGLIASSQLNRLLLRQFTPARVCLSATLALVAASALLCALSFRTEVTSLEIALPLFVCVSLVGLINPNATAVAFEHHAARAGVASSLLGALQFALAAASASLASAYNDGTARPMASAIALCAACALACQLTPALRRARGALR